MNGFLNFRNISSKFMLLGSMLLLAESGQTAENQWIQIEATGSGQIYHREAGNSSIPWIMIVTTFAAPPARVHTIVTDYNNFKAFIPNVAESRIVWDEDGNQWVYHHKQWLQVLPM